MRLTLYSNNLNYDQLLYYMYKEHSDKINEFSYLKATFFKVNFSNFKFKFLIDKCLLLSFFFIQFMFE